MEQGIIGGTPASGNDFGAALAKCAGQLGPEITRTGVDDVIGARGERSLAAHADAVDADDGTCPARRNRVR